MTGRPNRLDRAEVDDAASSRLARRPQLFVQVRQCVTVAGHRVPAVVQRSQARNV